MTVRPGTDVVVWTLTTDELALAADLHKYDGLLSAEDRARVERFRKPDDRVRFVLGRALARQLLSSLAAVEPHAWRFRIGSHGRPDVDMPGDLGRLRFNLSHTRGLLACAAALDCEVGVDVEHLDRNLAHDVAGRYFAPHEVADLRALPAADQERVFFDYWTLKEAYIKARGLGLAIPLDQFAFTLRASAAPTIAFAPELDDDPAGWQFLQAWPTPCHRLALAVRSGGAPRTVRFHAVRPEALVA